MTYWLYIASSVTPRFEPAQEFAAEDDETAIVAAELARGRRPAELWRGSEMVMEWKA